MISKRMAKRAKDSAVSPVIATILMVAITVVLAAVLYVMVSGFTHSPGTAQSAGLTEAANTTVSNNYVVTVTSVSATNIPITNLKVVISGAGTKADGTFAISAFGSPVPGSSTSYLNVTLWQISGNSATYLNVGDFFTISLGNPTADGAVLSGATVTLYNGNTNLGSVTL